MEFLSGELITMIIQHCDFSDLRHLRQSCRAIYPAATSQLFSHTHVIRDSFLRTSSHFYSILSCPHLSSEVTSVNFTAYVDLYKMGVDYHNSEEHLAFVEKFQHAVGCIKNFPNIQDVTIEFDAPGGVDRDPGTNWEGEESVDFIYGVLQTLFEVLHEKPRLKSLSISRLQNYIDRRLVVLPAFSSVMARIASLKLGWSSEFGLTGPGTNFDIHPFEDSWTIAQNLSFFGQLPATWLKLAQKNLTSLTLHTDDSWGYIPLCDFRPLHFPRLKKLELDHYMFSHDWQLDWIVSHCTLQELALDFCCIVKYACVFGPVDADNYALQPMSNDGQIYAWGYYRSWSENFAKIERLSHLKLFKFGASDLGKMGDLRYFDTMGELEWEVLGPNEWSYRALHRGYGLRMPVRIMLDIFRSENIVVPGGSGPYDPVAELEQDFVAYEKLMKTVERRAGSH